jgi:4-amino-4-deoxy-L-arabinose transferase-like glycosyltransferase
MPSIFTLALRGGLLNGALLNGAPSNGALPAKAQAAFALRWQLAALLLFHVLVWAWVGYASRSNFDSPGDMVEAYAWSQGWQWGYFKHPPLSAWVVGAWFALAPETHAGYALLAAVNSAVGLAGLAVLARCWLPGRWVLLVVALAALAPGLTTQALRFNANAVLIATWPWATALFVRFMQQGRKHDALACGAVCALALLGKYFSAVLLVSLVATALWLPVWRRRLFSTAALWGVASFALVLLPHVLWLLAQTEGPVQYAQAATGAQSAAESLQRALHFALAVAVAPVLGLLLLRPALYGREPWRALWLAASAPLRAKAHPVWMLAVLPIVFTMFATLATGARTASVWGLALGAGLALLAAQRLHSAGVHLNLRRLWCCLLLVWALIAALAPLWWHSRATAEVPTLAEPRAELAQNLASMWQQREGTALPFITGTRALAASTSFYAGEHPRYWSLWNPTVETPWVDLQAVAQAGGYIVCAASDTPCQTQAATWSAELQWLQVAKSARGHSFKPQRFAVWRIAPAPLAKR